MQNCTLMTMTDAEAVVQGLRGEGKRKRYNGGVDESVRPRKGAGLEE
jgi:hypothetical protein